MKSLDLIKNGRAFFLNCRIREPSSSPENTRRKAKGRSGWNSSIRFFLAARAPCGERRRDRNRSLDYQALARRDDLYGHRLTPEWPWDQDPEAFHSLLLPVGRKCTLLPVTLFILVSVATTEVALADDNAVIEKSLVKQVECLRKDPGNLQCRAHYNELKRQYLRPKCAGNKIRGKLLISDGSQEITERGVASLILDQDSDTKQGAISIQLDSVGAATLEKMTSGLLGKTLKIKAENYEIQPNVQSVIKDGRVMITFGFSSGPRASEMFQKLCPHPIVQKLKPELQP